MAHEMKWTVTDEANLHHIRPKARPDNYDLHNWICELSSYSSLQGIAWYQRTDSSCIKTSIFLSFMVAVVAIPIVLVVETGNFMSNPKISTYIEWHNADDMPYPYITVCNPRYFHNDRLAKYNISVEMANYMVMGMDWSMFKYAAVVREDYEPGVYDRMMSNLSNELDFLLNRHNFTSILDLFYDVSLSCDDFIEFCVYHQEIYHGDRVKATGRRSCCSVFFNERPFFSTVGVCFTSKTRPVETIDATFNSFKIVLNQCDKIAPEFKMQYKGTDGMDREGAAWVVTDQNTPAYTLNNSLCQTLQPWSDLKYPKSKISQRCFPENKTFEEVYGVPSTMGNCLIISRHFNYPNCSIAMYHGLKAPDPSLKPCLPAQVVYNEPDNSKSVIEKRLGYNVDCEQDCFRTDYEMSITTGRLGSNVLRSFVKDMDLPKGWMEIENGMLLQFYFESFQYTVNILQQQSFIDFLSQVGGWLGLVIGASAFSLVEMVYFLVRLMKVVFNRVST